ncbi:GM19498 [Drosophila sechellia]|uniref:GM19498 n=1 Tax=Drosophila sechellia TaxID=7238 RepID=B4IHG0_DROSE|nr:GM19498 [Drosophila sechellia]
MDQRNLTLPTPAATTIMSSSSAAMSAGFASLGGPTTSALAGSTIALATTTTAPPTTTPATFFTYSIPGMDIAPGPFIFTYVSEFLSLITPEELPLGKSLHPCAVALHPCARVGSKDIGERVSRCVG